MRITISAIVACAAAMAPGIAAAQTLLWEHVSTNSTVTVDSDYGSRIFMPGDLNFDGVNDVLVSSAYSPNGAQPNAGYVGVLSGVDGSVIYELHGIGGGVFWGVVLRCDGLCPGDVDGDGATDFWISYGTGPLGGLVSQVVSGATGLAISNPPAWASIYNSRVGDLTGDGIDDIVSTNGPLTLYAGPTYSQSLWSVPIPIASPLCTGRRFQNVVPIGDVNGDGVLDLLTGV